MVWLSDGEKNFDNMFSRFYRILCKFLLVLNCNCFYLVPFLAYSALNNGVTLNSWFEVTQGHW